MEKQTILEEHNIARQLLAMGKVTGQPAARNMREMVWDEELARIAQRWADQCMPEHDLRRNVGEGYSTVLDHQCYTFVQIGLRLVRTWPPHGLFIGCLLTKTLLSSKDTSRVGLMRYYKITSILLITSQCMYQVYKYSWRSWNISPFIFSMDTGHYTQVGSVITHLNTGILGLVLLLLLNIVTACLGRHLHGRVWLYLL
jgi:hypothetical protein